MVGAFFSGPLEAGVDRAVFIMGDGIALHGAFALGAVMEAHTAPGDEFPGLADGVIHGFPFHLGEHQGVIRGIADIEHLPTGDKNLERGLAVHNIPSW